MLAAAACLRGLADIIAYLIEQFLLWVADLLEALKQGLRRCASTSVTGLPRRFHSDGQNAERYARFSDEEYADPRRRSLLRIGQ